MPKTSTATATAKANETAPVETTINRPAVATRNDEAQTRLFKFVDNHGFYETLIMLQNYCEKERASVPTNDQPLRVYWRRIQTFVKEAAERTFKQKV